MVQSAQLSGLVATDNPNEPTRVARHGGFVAGVGFGGHARTCAEICNISDLCMNLRLLLI